mgnify:CR=1 FL=1
MKKYVVEFTEVEGKSYEFEFITNDIDKSIEEYCRNRVILAHRVLNESTNNKKQMLLG